VAWPVITSTVTTCLAFAPLLFWPDIMGQFMSFLPITLITTLGASLFVAMVINPAICSIFISEKGRRHDLDEYGVADSRLIRMYERVLRAANHHRIVVLFIGFLFLIASVEFYIQFGRGMELFPDVDPRNAIIQVQFPQGTSIERTDEAIGRIEALLPEYEDITFYLATVGQQDDMLSMGANATHIGQVFIEFKVFNERSRPATVMIDEIRGRLPKIPGADITIEKQEEGPPTGAPVSIEVYGEDFDTLAALAARIMRAIENVPGLVDLQSDFEEALPELQFHVDRHRAALLGLDTRSIGFFLRTSVHGAEASKFRPDADEFDITLRLPLHQRDSVDLLHRLSIPTPSGTSVPLSSLGEIRYEGGRGAITRKDQKRMITISGNDQNRGVDEIIAEVMPIVDAIPMPRGYSISYAGDTEEMRKSGAFLMQAFLVAIGMIMIILVVQFNSVFMPLIIGFSVVLSLIGVLWGLLLTGTRFGVIMTGMGVVSLAGIVVNNSIVLIDCIRQRKAEGMDTETAVVLAGKMRLRPVLLTAITTILGLLPMAIGFSLEIHQWPPRIVAGAESSEWWAPMAVAVIFGLGMATFLTLVLVPVMFSLFDSWSTRLRARFAPEEEAAR
jgi:multidrug efflux pump subunit AcrB